MPTGIINLAIVDDHTLVRKTLQSFLSQQSNIKILIQAANIVDLLTELAKKSVDVLIMDVFMPNSDGYVAFKTIKKQYPEIKIIALSMNTDLYLINDLLDIGINAYIAKHDEPENLLQAIFSVSENRIYRNKLFTEALYLNRQNIIRNQPEKKTDLLDDREKKILQLLWEEKSNKEIADEIFLSVRSIEKIRQDMKEKLDIASTIGLLKYALRNNIINIYKEYINLNGC